MGGGRWDDKDWTSYATTRSYASKSVKEIFTSRGMDKTLDPHGAKVREARDSTDNPASTAIIVALDVTGSMGRISEAMARKGLNTLCNEIYSRRPVSDPQVMLMGVGDVTCDSAPLQVTQFEADIRIAQQLEKIYLEGGGGGNSYESYNLPWYFASMHTSIDCFEKRGKKGYLFTIGDEQVPPALKPDQIEKVLGYRPQTEMSTEDLFTAVSRMYEVFHLMVEEGSHFHHSGDKVVKGWTELLGQRAIRLADHTKLAEVIVSLIQVNEGEDSAKVSGSWDGTTSLVVSKAIGGYSNAMVSKPTVGSVVRF